MPQNKIKVSIGGEDYNVTVEIPETCLNDASYLPQIVKKMQECYKSMTNRIKAENESNTKPEETSVVNVSHDDRIFKTRERLPNNIIDIKDLDVKQAITEKAFVRCPNCGQVHCLAVNSGSKVYVMERDFNKDDFNIIAEFDSLTSNGFIGMCCKPDTNRLDYFNDLQSLPIISNSDFVVNNDTEIFCPVCCTSNNFYDWKDAYENPLKYFETEHLCDVCGGETVTKMVKEQKVNKCEKCGHETKYMEA